jgi:methionyl-tRNA formyltransferase
MRVLFFGTSAFAVPALDALHTAKDRHPILAVVTQPDRPSGRGLRLQPSPIKRHASELGYRLLQPERVRRVPFPAEAMELAPDVLVVVSFGQIIPQRLLDLPPYGGVNVHASLLPRWRGAAPIHRAILAGDVETGVATMRMEATLDTGPVFLVAQEPIREDDTVGSLEPRLAALGAGLLVETLDLLQSGGVTPITQASAGMTYAAPMTREDGLLDPLSESAAQLERRIRATMPKPGAFLQIAGRTLRVLEAKVDQADRASEGYGSVRAIGREGVAVSTIAGDLILVRVQPENRGPMPAADWARGARIGAGSVAARPAAQGAPSSS